MNKLLGSVLISQFYFGFASVCCPEKKVGDKTYQLITDGDTTQFDCMNGCIYSVKGEDATKRFCFKSGGLPAVCQNNDGGDGTFYSTPLPFFNFNNKSDVSGISTQSEEDVIEKHQEAYGVELRSCASATFGIIAQVKIELEITAVSSTKAKESSEKITQYLKEEYKSEFTESISNEAYGVSFAMDWLGISASGQYSNSETVRNYYENGESSLEAARKEFTQSLENVVDSKSKITGSATIPGISREPVEFCLFFRIMNIRFSNGETTTVVIDDPNQAKTATSDGKEVPHEGQIELEVQTF